MINKSESNIASAAILSPFSNMQGVMGNWVNVSNTSDTPISALPLEMIYHIGSFLNLKDKVSFSQSLIDAGLGISLDCNKILQEFNNQFLTQKIDILLESNKHNYDCSKFYALDVQNEAEATDIYSLLFNQMCDAFKKEKVLSEKIALLIETLSLDNIDVVRVRHYLGRADPTELKDSEGLINYLFPNLADPEIRKEIDRRVQLFDIAWNSVFTNRLPLYPQEVVEELLVFLKMDEKYRGMPIELAMRTQKLANSHLAPIIQKAGEKIQAMPAEALRSLLIMGLDELQAEDFCEKMIEFGAKDNPFYSKGSPYFYALKSDLSCRASMTKPNRFSLFFDVFDYDIFKYHIVYHASDAYLREHVSHLMNLFLEIQIKNGEDPVSVTHYGNFSSYSTYKVFIQNFYEQMEKKYQMESFLTLEYESRRSFLRDMTPVPSGLAVNSPKYILDSVARCEMSFTGVERFLNEYPHHINAQNSNGDTLLHLFIKQNIPHMLETLIKLGADLNIKNQEGFTPFMLAVQFEEMFAVNVLLKQPALDVNQCDNFGNTALHHAVIANKKMAILRLLRHEAIDQNIVNHSGTKAYELLKSAEFSSLFSTSLNLTTAFE